MNILFLLFALGVFASELVRVNDKNFKEVAVESGKWTLVDFYADWCRHCSNLMPTIEQLAEVYKDEPDIQIVKLNGDEDGKKTTRKYNVPGFPTLLMFHGSDDPIEYEGMRDLDAISNFVQSVSGIRLGAKPAPEVVEPTNILSLNDDNFQDTVLRANHKTVVAVTAPWCRFCKELEPIFNKLANEIYIHDGEVVQFGKVDLSDENKQKCETITKQFGVEKLPTIFLFDPLRVDKDGLRRPVIFDDDRDLESLIAFVNDETGLCRNEEGRLHSNAGRIMAIDQALKTKSPEAILEELEALEEEVKIYGRDALVNDDVLFFKDDVSMIPYYKKLLKKIQEGDREFFSREFARLERLLATEEKNIEKGAYDHMQKRASVLQSFLSAKA